MINRMRDLCLSLVLQTRSRVQMMTAMKLLKMMMKVENEDDPVKLPHLKSLREAIACL